MYLQLYAHNVPVPGAASGAIYNLHQGTLVRVPSVLLGLLAQLAEAPLATVRQRHAYDLASFDRYIEFLLARDLAFQTEEPARFPALAPAWHYPGLLTHAVLEYEFAHYALPDVLRQLDRLLCRHLELRLDLGGQPWPALDELLASLATSTFRTVALFVRHTEDSTPAALDALYAAHPKLTYIFCHSAPATVRSTQHARVLTTRWKLAADGRLPELPAPRYIVNSQFFAEAQLHNPYYHGRVCVGRLGQFKNCLRHMPSFGQVQETPLLELIAQPDFQELWYASADKIEGLSDSEFRYALWLPYALRRTAAGRYALIEAEAESPLTEAASAHIPSRS
jgi:hypothetical protein